MKEMKAFIILTAVMSILCLVGVMYYAFVNKLQYEIVYATLGIYSMILLVGVTIQNKQKP